MSSKLWKIAGAIALVAALTITIVAYGAENEKQLDESSITIVEEKPEIVEEVPKIIVITTESEYVPSPLERKYTSSNVNVRTTPELRDDNIFTILSRGTELEICTVKDGWYEIVLGSEHYYVYSENVVTAEEYEELCKVPYNSAVPLSEELQKYLWFECKDIGMKYSFALALMDIETGGTFRPDLISKTNDWGITQINKCNHKLYIQKGWITCSEDLLNPYNGIHCGLDFMNQYVQKYGHVERAYASYNTGKAIKSNRNSRIFMEKWNKWISILGDI